MLTIVDSGRGGKKGQKCADELYGRPQNNTIFGHEHCSSGPRNSFDLLYNGIEFSIMF